MNNQTKQKEYAREIYQRRRAAEIRQADLAAELGIDRMAISFYENGKLLISPEVLRIILAAIDKLAYGKDEAHDNERTS